MENLNLLIVDDEERFLNTTKALLEKQGISTSIAINGYEALKIMEERPADVVIIDVKMPGMDGVEVLTKIKHRFPLVQVILLTGHASVESAVEGLKMGAFDYLTKPCDIPELMKKVKQALEKKRADENKKASKQKSSP